MHAQKYRTEKMRLSAAARRADAQLANIFFNSRLSVKAKYQAAQNILKNYPDSVRRELQSHDKAMETA